MGSVYLFAAIVGVILLGAALFGSGHQGAHDIGSDGADGAVSDSTGGDGHETQSPLSAAGALLSLRFWTYVLTFGGLAGLTLRYLAHQTEPIPAIAALASGVLAGVLARVLIGRLTHRPAAAPLKTESLVGNSASVLVPFDQGTTGKIRVQLHGSTVDLLATTDDPTLQSRDEVIIVEIREGSRAHVTRNPAVPSDPSDQYKVSNNG